MSLLPAFQVTTHIEVCKTETQADAIAPIKGPTGADGDAVKVRGEAHTADLLSAWQPCGYGAVHINKSRSAWLLFAFVVAVIVTFWDELVV